MTLPLEESQSDLLLLVNNILTNFKLVYFPSLILLYSIASLLDRSWYFEASS
jgi:hypothetical protein